MQRSRDTVHLVLFFALAYGLSWLIWLPLYLPKLGVDALPSFPFNHAVGGLGPMLAAFFMSYVSHGKEGLTRLLKSMFDARNVLMLAIALFSPFVLLLIAAFVNQLTNGVPVDLSGVGRTIEFPEFSVATYFVYNLIFFGYGEEVGWKGFAFPRFQKHFNALVASLVFTAFWALWHWPLFLYRPGYDGMGLVGITGWFFSLLTGRILLTWLFNESRGSVLVCAVFHATIDVAFVSDATDKSTVNFLGMLITFWGIATVLIFGWKNLSRKPRVTELPPTRSTT